MGRFLIWLLFSFRGRIGRAQWWLGCLLVFLVDMPAFCLQQLSAWDLYKEYFIPLTILTLVTAYVSFSVDAKRFHDRGRGAGWALFGTVLILLDIVQLCLWYLDIDRNAEYEYGLFGAELAMATWFIIYLGCIRGDSGPNQYGEDPVPLPVLSIPGTRRSPLPSERPPEENTSLS
jgi:uncharacterized membrane protein YhaH (DUF805 family)